MERPVTSRIAPQQARSWLLVPASKPDTFDAALASAADAVILDLEDAVTAPNKPAARRDVAAFLSEHNHAWVRIN
ncbi:aldolase/citrate lyase family protein, partial [Rhodococcus erythropolis]|nr:aldolase/citrate lyase family protein [Rhodococcus erythropolis]